MIGSPAEGLLPWLENYTFPHESRFSDAAYAQGMADVFLDELQRQNQDLISALDDLRQQKDQLLRLNAEAATTDQMAALRDEALELIRVGA